MANRHDFKDKVVLITGASSGIGEGIAIHFASLQAKLVITGRNQARLNLVAQKCGDPNNAQVLPLTADLTNSESLKLLINETIKRFGQLDVLVNNAGIFQLASLADGNYLQLYKEIMDTNLKSVVELTRLALPHLIEVKGNVVNVSSVASYKPGATNSIYAMTKAAIDMFTKCLAVELGPSGVRVNAINPAAIRTPIFDLVQAPGMTTDSVAVASAASYPLRRIGEPEDCAKAVAYLASQDASFVTGVCMLIDGGSAYTELILPEEPKK